LSNFFWIPAFAGMTKYFNTCVSCHPGLDPGSIFKITPRIRFEAVSLDSRFHGNDNLISFFFMLV
jgi:hypothetical protein